MHWGAKYHSTIFTRTQFSKKKPCIKSDKLIRTPLLKNKDSEWTKLQKLFYTSNKQNPKLQQNQPRYTE